MVIHLCMYHLHCTDFFINELYLEAKKHEVSCFLLLINIDMEMMHLYYKSLENGAHHLTSLWWKGSCSAHQHCYSILYIANKGDCCCYLKCVFWVLFHLTAHLRSRPLQLWLTRHMFLLIIPFVLEVYRLKRSRFFITLETTEEDWSPHKRRVDGVVVRMCQSKQWV